MKRFLPLLLAALALASCQRDNFFKELGEDTAPDYSRLAPDNQVISAPVAFRGSIPSNLQNALKARTHLPEGDLVENSAMVIIGSGFLTESGTMPADTLIETAYHNGVIISVVQPDYAWLSEWCEKKGIVFPAVPSEDDNILLCAFSNRGWLYDMDAPHVRDPWSQDYNSWLNPFVTWVNAHIGADTMPEPYVIGSGDPLVFERNLACQQYDHTYFLALNDTVSCIHPYKADTLDVLSQMTAHFTSWPVSGTDRDWYLCHASLSINNAPMFCDVAVSTSGGIRTKFCGYEMRRVGFSFDLGAGPQGADGFEQKPLPGSAEAGESFEPDFDWNLESGAITEGPVTARRSTALTVAAPLQHKGQRTGMLPDLNIENNSADGVVNYLFTVPSEQLGYMHRTEIYPSEAAICRTGRDDLESSWVWRLSPSSMLQPVLRIGTTSIYTSMYFRSTTVGAGCWKDHYGALSSTQRKIRLLSPGRVQTGQLQLSNDYADAASCVALRFWAEGKDPKKDTPDYDALWSVVAPGGCFVRNMEAGRYLMQFYKQSADGQKMWLQERMVDIAAAQATTLAVSEL